MARFYLASASPRRKEILESVGIKPIVVPSNIDESEITALPPEKKVMELALLKCADAAKGVSKGDYVIAADTVVVCGEKIMGKPVDKEDAFKMLMALSGRWHSVFTGYCAADGKSGRVSAAYEETRVKFREIEESEARYYIDTREPMDKAGAYGIQGKGRLFVERIDGDYYNVVGLPICALCVMLKKDFGIDILYEG